MTYDTFIALFGFAVATSITPGPNNFMLLASGVNFGFRRTIPHMLGVAGGFWILSLAVGAGLGSLLSLVPSLYLALKIAGGAYLLWLAWKTATTRSFGAAEAGPMRPMTFLQAAAFQWVNPKAWVMALTAMAMYVDPARPFVSVFLVAGVFALVNLPTVSLWAGFGTALRGFLADPARLRRFNLAMGLLLAATLWPMLK